MSSQENSKLKKLTYGTAKDYYQQKDYVRAVEAFQQVIALEENATRKRYTIYAERYIKRANDQLDRAIEKELSEAEVKWRHNLRNAVSATEFSGFRKVRSH